MQGDREICGIRMHDIKESIKQNNLKNIFSKRKIEKELKKKKEQKLRGDMLENREMPHLA